MKWPLWKFLAPFQAQSNAQLLLVSFFFFFSFICLIGLMWRLNELTEDEPECHLHVGCYKKKEKKIQEKRNWKNKGPSQPVLQGPYLGTAQIFATDSNCWQFLQGKKKARPMPLSVALSEN